MPFYIRILDKRMVPLSIIHFFLGIFVSSNESISTYWGLLILIYGLLHIIRYRNKFDEASIFAAYIVGLEVLLRTVGASLLWEFGKYATILLLVTGMIVDNLKFLRINILSLTYIICLFPSIYIMPEVEFKYMRQMISGNLSGPLCLFFSFLYFRRKIFVKKNVTNLFKALTLPIWSQIGLIIARMPSIKDLSFSSEANFHMSAGYGPNQVSTILGVSLIIVGISKLFHLKIYKYAILEYVFIGVAIGLALLTFARGGVLAPVISIIIGILISLRFRKYNINFKKLFYIVLLILGLAYFASNFTKGLIDSRYMALTSISVQEATLSGRTKIMAIDIQIFLDNLLMGVGPGSAHALRWEYGYETAVAAHSEFTRMLAEHGLFGAISLFSIIILSVIEYKQREGLNQILLACFSIFSLLTMFHSAFRIALAGYIYGFSYVLLKFDKE